MTTAPPNAQLPELTELSLPEHCSTACNPQLALLIYLRSLHVYEAASLRALYRRGRLGRSAVTPTYDCSPAGHAA
jgi:hypothetical protein